MIFGRKVRLRPSRLENKGWFAYLVRDLPKAGADGKTQAPLPLVGTHGPTPAEAYRNFERMYV